MAVDIPRYFTCLPAGPVVLASFGLYSLNNSQANRAHRAEPASMNRADKLNFSDSSPAAETNIPVMPPGVSAPKPRYSRVWLEAALQFQHRVSPSRVQLHAPRGRRGTPWVSHPRSF